MDRKMELTIDCVECQLSQVIKIRMCDLERYKAGEGHVQTIFPYLTPSEREMFTSQICGNCWDKIFHKDDDEL